MCECTTIFLKSRTEGGDGGAHGRRARFWPRPTSGEATDAQYEVSILGSMLGKPNQGSMIALNRVTRFLKGTRDFVNKPELDNEVDKHVVRLDGFSD